MKNINLVQVVVRLFFISLTLPVVIYFKEFYMHFYAHFTGNFINHLIINNWKIVIINIILFCLFLIPLSYRKKANWKDYGMVSAFFVSLFIEMYGIPFTMLFASHYFIQSSTNIPENLVKFTLFGTNFGMTLAMTYAAFIILIGVLFILIGWITLYLNVKKNRFVTNGIYSISRHPQYIGFILIIIGWFIGWPTILTLVFSPLLIYRYIKVCKIEEQEIKVSEPMYQEYQKKVPFFI